MLHVFGGLKRVVASVLPGDIGRIRDDERAENVLKP